MTDDYKTKQSLKNRESVPVLAKHLTYTVELYPDREHGGYTVVVPALPGCISQGRTIEECLERIKEAIEGYIECLKDEGKRVPVEEEPEGRIKVEVAA